MPDLTPEEIDHLLKLEAKATPGPWKVREESCAACLASGDSEWDIDPLGHAYHAHLSSEADALFIAAARNIVRPLAERVRELEAENARLRENEDEFRRRLDALNPGYWPSALSREIAEEVIEWVREALAQKEERSA